MSCNACLSTITTPSSIGCLQVDMVSPLTQCQITFPVHLDRPVAREQLWWLNSACKLLETRLLQVRMTVLYMLALVCAIMTGLTPALC